MEETTTPKTRILIVIDMQKDFIDGALANPAAAAIVEPIRRMIENGNYERVIFTQDTHGDDYLKTQEGRMLPIVHCVPNSYGIEIDHSLLGAAYARYYGAGSAGYGTEPQVIRKKGFGSPDLVEELKRYDRGDHAFMLVGTCTDICVLCNALLLKAFFPETPIIVKQSLCAGTTPANHAAAIALMKGCQIIIEE